ncbi:MAG: class I SAM-dependent methyltransferase [Omnitrophica WOR_2 bacterium]
MEIRYFLFYYKLQTLPFRIRRFLRQRVFSRWANLIMQPLPPQSYIWIDPQRIQHACLDKPSRSNEQNRMARNGDWDLVKIHIDDLLAARALQQRYQQGLPWEETAYRWESLEQSESGRRIRQVYPQKELWRAALHNLDRLHIEMKTRKRLSSQPATAGDEVRVCIGRNGEILADGNSEKLILARLLGIPSISAQVTARHPNWLKFRRSLLGYARDVGGRLYQPATHPDLGDIPSSHDNSRWQVIESSLPIKTGKVLDIGANLGYFCQKFEQKGFDCIAVEMDQRSADLMEKLKIAEDRHFQIFKGSIFNFTGQDEFDIVLALNILHHFFHFKDELDSLVCFLKRIHMRYMFLETHLPDEEYMQKAYRNYSPDEVVQFVLANSCLENATFLKIVEEGRPLYLLSI